MYFLDPLGYFFVFRNLKIFIEFIVFILNSGESIANFESNAGCKHLCCKKTLLHWHGFDPMVNKCIPIDKLML